MIKKNTWVEIEKVVLTKEERADNIPQDTKAHPLMMWVKGFLLEDATLDSTVKIKTKTGRIEEGKLVKASPSFNHNFGNYVSELAKIDEIVLSSLYGDDHE